MRRLFHCYTYWFLLAGSLMGLWGCANLMETLPPAPAFLTPIHLQGPYDADIPLREFNQIKNASLMQEQAVPYLFLRVADHFAAAGDQQRSLHFYDRAMDEFRKRNNMEGEGSASSRKVAALIHFGCFNEVYQLLEEKNRIYRNGPLHAFVLYQYGYYHLKRGNCAEAQKFFEKTIALTSGTSDNADWLALWRDAEYGFGLAVILGDYFPVLSDCLSTMNSDNVLSGEIHRRLKTGASHLETALVLDRRIREAVAYRHDRELASPFTECDTHNLLGLAYGMAGDMPPAVTHLDKAADLARKINYPLGKADHSFFSGLIYLFSPGWVRGIREIQSLLDIAEKYQLASYSIWAKLMTAYTARRAGDIDKAIQAVNEAILCLEENASWISGADGYRGIRFFPRRAIHETLIELYSMKSDQQGAFLAAERMKGAFLAERLPEEMTGKADEATELLGKLRAYRRQLAGNYKKLVWPAREMTLLNTVEQSQKARKAIEKLLSAIRVKDQALYPLVGGTAPPVEEIQRLLDSNTTLFSYYAGEKSLYIWVISRSAIHQEIVRISRDEVDRLLTFWIEAMKRRDKELADMQAEKVYDLLLKPVIPFVRGDRVGFVPDVMFFNLPFAAMRYVKSYLVDGFSIFLLPCTGMLKFLLADSSALDMKRSVFVEDAVCLEERHPAVQEEEMSVLKKLFPKAESIVLSRHPENGRGTITGSYGIILAGLSDPCGDKPTSASRRATVNESGSLAGEIIRLKINAPLTLLTICRNRRLWAMEKTIAGSVIEWLYGISPRVIMQMWDVDEKAHKAFWKLFHESLKKSGHAADALRIAQNGMIQSGFGPSDWAAFVLTGRY